jgi:hypothetical protein
VVVEETEEPELEPEPLVESMVAEETEEPELESEPLVER